MSTVDPAGEISAAKDVCSCESEPERFSNERIQQLKAYLIGNLVKQGSKLCDTSSGENGIYELSLFLMLVSCKISH
jgi:hypothetical protein